MVLKPAKVIVGLYTAPEGSDDSTSNENSDTATTSDSAVDDQDTE